MKKFLIIFLFLIGCATENKEITKKISDINSNEDLSFEEFKIRLEIYANDNPYPNIDEQ